MRPLYGRGRSRPLEMPQITRLVSVFCIVNDTIGTRLTIVADSLQTHRTRRKHYRHELASVSVLPLGEYFLVVVSALEKD